MGLNGKGCWGSWPGEMNEFRGRAGGGTSVLKQGGLEGRSWEEGVMWVAAKQQSAHHSFLLAGWACIKWKSLVCVFQSVCALLSEGFLYVRNPCFYLYISEDFMFFVVGMRREN